MYQLTYTYNIRGSWRVHVITMSVHMCLCLSAWCVHTVVPMVVYVFAFLQYVLADIYVCKCVSVCRYVCTVATYTMQSRELQSVKSTLTFMVLTSQGHLKAERLEWRVTFQTENNSWVFSGLWRRLFILSLTLIHFDPVRGSNGLNNLICLLLFCSRCLFTLLLFCMLSPSYCVTVVQDTPGHRQWQCV